MVADLGEHEEVVDVAPGDLVHRPVFGNLMLPNSTNRSAEGSDVGNLPSIEISSP